MEQGDTGPAFHSHTNNGGDMYRASILAAALLCTMGSVSMAQTTAISAQPNTAAKEFVEQAGTSGLAEVEMAELGVQKAKSGQVKAFAKQVVADHNKANAELQTAIKGKGLQIPASRSATHKTTMDKFHQQEAGKEFDRDFVAQMIEDHKADVELFEAAADNEELDIELRGYAKRVLPTLRDHLKQAQTIQSKLSD